MLLVNVIKFQGWMYYSVTKTTTKVLQDPVWSFRSA